MAQVSDDRAHIEAELLVALRDLSLDDLTWLLEHIDDIPALIHRHDVELPAAYLKSREG